MQIPLGQKRRKPQARLRRPSHHGKRWQRLDKAVPVARLPVSRSRAQTSVRARRRGELRARERSTTASPKPTMWSQVRHVFAVRWWGLLILFLVLGVAAYASIDERFFVYAAEISGVQHLDPQAIYSAAGVDKQSIFWIDARRIEENLAGVQGVKTVHVRCGLPSSVSIQIEERQPVILWRLDGEKRDWWLDAEGMVLTYHGDPSAADTVFVVDYSGRHLEAGKQIEPANLASSVLQMAASLSGVRVFYYDADRGLYFTQKVQGGEWPVYVGDSKDLARKIQVTELLTRHFEEDDIRPAYLDVRWAGRPVYGSLAGAASAGGN